MINTNYAMRPIGLPITYSPLSAVSPVPSGLDFGGRDTVTLGSDLGSAGDFLNQMAELKSLARRQEAVADLPSAQMPANWDTMSVGDFLNEMGRIRESLGPSKTEKSAEEKKKEDGDGKGTFGVNAHKYWDYSKGEYVEVEKVDIHKKGDWNTRGNSTWNAGHANDVNAEKEDAELGSKYQVTVTWADGKSKTWDYTNVGQTVDVYSPN